MSHQDLKTTHYVFDPSRLEPGDIVLSTVPLNLKHWLIRLATRGDYSHAAICTDTGLLVEAFGPGVCRLGTSRIAVRNKKVVKILRLKQDGDRDALAIARRAARVAEAALTKGYFLRGAILSIFKRLPASSQTKVFCSQLVVYAYRESGLELFPGVRPEKTSPGMLADLAKANSGYPALLKDVTGSVLHLETEPLLIPPDVLDEGIDDDTPHTREVEIMRAVVKRLSKSFRCLGLVEPPTFEDALMKLANLKGEVAHAIDEEFSKALEEERYLKLFDYFYFVAYKEPALQLDSIVNDVLTKRTRTQLEALLHYYERRLAVRMADVRHRTLQVQAFRAQYEKTGFRTVGQLLEGYESTLQLQ